MIKIFEYNDGEYDELGQVEDSEVVEGDEFIEDLVETIGDEDEIFEELNGPRLVAAKQD